MQAPLASAPETPAPLARPPVPPPALRALRMGAALLVLPAALVLLAACGGGAKVAEGAVERDPLLAQAVLAEAPAEAAPVQAVREAPVAGETVVVTGRVGGVLHPFSETHAVMILIDDEIETCERIPGDECPTPWDACCEDPAKLKAMRLTVQFVDETGEPLVGTLKGLDGLEELDTVVVRGTVSEGASEENLVIDASGFFRKES